MNIDIGSITGILLADGWHDVFGKSANVGSVTLYERVGEHDTSIVYDGGNFSALWFSIQEQPAPGIPLMGPLSSVLAVRLKP